MEFEDKLEDLAGKPEKLKKQVHDRISSFTYLAITIVMNGMSVSVSVNDSRFQRHLLCF